MRACLEPADTLTDCSLADHGVARHLGVIVVIILVVAATRLPSQRQGAPATDSAIPTWRTSAALIATAPAGHLNAPVQPPGHCLC